MKQTAISALSLALIVTTGACTRDDNSPGGTAGKGGGATLKLVLKHHGLARNIISAETFIKYNTQDAPAFYDDSVDCVQADTMSVGTFSGLKKGDYYVYGRGFDTTIKQYVVGGAKYTISQETVQTITLNVTEGD